MFLAQLYSLFLFGAWTFTIDDTNRNLTELIESRGFKFEQHFIKTDDNYILQLVRIINPFVKDQKNLKPILLHHGFQCSGTMWLIATNGYLDPYGNYLEYYDNNNYDNSDNHHAMIRNGTRQIANTLGFLLATKNYDVWLANYRGGIYSQNHTKLKPDNDEFWKFSMNEMIEIDLPKQIDYIINKTEYSTISYIGHSQGNLMMLSLMSIDDEYSKKIRPFIALSPVFYNVQVSSALNLLSPLRTVLREFPMFFPWPNSFRIFLSNLAQNIFLRKLFFAVMYPFLGSKLTNIMEERFPAYMASVPMGSSSWNAAHLGQIFNVGHMEKFDFGYEDNLKYYGQEKPPIYDPKRINSTHIALIYSENDWLNDMKSVEKLKSNLNVKLLDDYLIPDITYNHIDMIWGKTVGTLVNSKILDILSKY